MLERVITNATQTRNTEIKEVYVNAGDVIEMASTMMMTFDLVREVCEDELDKCRVSGSLLSMLYGGGNYDAQLDCAFRWAAESCMNADLYKILMRILDDKDTAVCFKPVGRPAAKELIVLYNAFAKIDAITPLLSSNLREKYDISEPIPADEVEEINNGIINELEASIRILKDYLVFSVAPAETSTVSKSADVPRDVPKDECETDEMYRITNA